MSSGFTGKLTPLQIQKLNKAGINNIYQLITYFPYKSDTIIPFCESEKIINQKYLLNGYISRFEVVSRGVKFFKLDISGKNNIQLYLFNSAPYIIKMLNQSCEFQFIISNKNGFWIIDKFAEKKNTEKKSFAIGSASPQVYIVPKYTRILALTDTTLNAIHQRLQRLDYILNLKGLVPSNNNLIPEQIDLNCIHHPTSTSQSKNTQKQFTSLQVFIKVALLKKINMNNRHKLGVGSTLEPTYLKIITDSLPYALSNSQKTTIQNILDDLDNK